MNIKNKTRNIIIIILALFIIIFIASFTAEKFTVYDENFKVMEQIQYPARLSHRGGAMLFPENTIFAFENIRQIDPVTIIEMDIQQTADGKIIVLHDTNTLRTTGDDIDVSKASYDQIRQLDAAYMIGYGPANTYLYRGLQIYIPLFSEVLSKFPAAIFDIEIKNRDNIDVKKIIDIIKENNAEDRVILNSKYHKIIVKVRELSPSICTGFSQKEITEFVILQKLHLLSFYTPPAPVLQIPVYSNYSSQKGLYLGSKGFIKSVKKKGLKVFYWTINDMEQMKKLLDAGASGIITDRPDLLKECIR